MYHCITLRVNLKISRKQADIKQEKKPFLYFNCLFVNKNVFVNVRETNLLIAFILGLHNCTKLVIHKATNPQILGIVLELYHYIYIYVFHCEKSNVLKKNVITFQRAYQDIYIFFNFKAKFVSKVS